MPLFADPDLLIQLYDGGTISAAELIERGRTNTSQSIVLKGWKSYDLASPVPVHLTECQHFECSPPFLLTANTRTTFPLHAATRVLSRTRWSLPAGQHATLSGGILASAFKHMKNMLRMERHDRSKVQSAHAAAPAVPVNKFTLTTVGHLSGRMRPPAGQDSPPIEILDTNTQPVELLDVSHAPKSTCDWAAIGVSGGDLLAISHRQDDTTQTPIWIMDDGDPIRQSALDMYVFIANAGDIGQYTPLRSLTTQRLRVQSGTLSDPPRWWMRDTNARVRLRFPEITDQELKQIGSTSQRLMALACECWTGIESAQRRNDDARVREGLARERRLVAQMISEHPALAPNTIHLLFGRAQHFSMW